MNQQAASRVKQGKGRWRSMGERIEKVQDLRQQAGPDPKGSYIRPLHSHWQAVLGTIKRHSARVLRKTSINITEFCSAASEHGLGPWVVKMQLLMTFCS